ncbi:hypothetical protein Pmar_PMAR019192 [Perkinsus marinus ATCC 50983]|uniref:Uncharacterized protein n=1 Tax=Perkinsus marinus (strain ATCC 50983 / TXsc) TaxID=423536 RepID=C5KU44_PERM5|nr:hypothetical protein Pmar_PMAR019192 [Perkinsus marinus ATCC 50983]EER12086.1 hypothetical protein Pmar_PMAR019192 [Perkinsus marinus ATCC 50983]|eukprot:XP_002780291.1 hypothetical protein Pmar_PMAR019192 [Perkinsus marinus ATCC 50983]
MDDIKGYKEYRVSGKVAGKTCFKTFLPLVSEEKRTKPLPFKHPVVSTANQICTENGLLLSTAFEEPVPNGVYYGFIENGMEATIKFDGKSRVQHVGINGTDRGRYNKVTFNMIGKAIHCMFGSRERSATAELILEPIDVTKFDGSRRSFSSARLNTVIGQPFNSNELRVILGIRKTNKLKAIGSQIATGVKSLVRPGSALRMKNGLAAEGIADA